MAELEPLSPEWWLRRLEGKLEARRAYLAKFDDYYSGRHPLPFLTKAHNAKMRDEFARLLEDCRSNFMRLIVDAAEERLRVEGFRLSAKTDPVADQRSWDIWQANGLDSESQTAIVEAMVKGVSYLSVWLPSEPGGIAPIAIEDPCETIIAYTPGSNFRQRDAAAKVWHDDIADVWRANVYLPDGIYKFQAPYDKAAVTASSAPGSKRTVERQWAPLAGDDAFVPNPLGIVPIVPLRNRPRLHCEGESDLADLTDTQDRINGQLFLRALAGYFGAHRQRWAVGLKIHEDDHGKPVEPFDVAIDRLLVAEDADVKFGDFAPTPLDGYVQAIEQDVQHLAIVSRTPRHYLIPEGQEPSGDSIRAAEAGLCAKVRRKMRHFGEAFEEAIRLARRFQGEADAPPDSEIVWADPETRSMGVSTDAIVKQFQAGLIPWEQAVQELGYTQTEIARMAAMRERDQLLRALLPSSQPVAEGEEALTE